MIQGELLGEAACENKGEEESRVNGNRGLGIPGIFVNRFFSKFLNKTNLNMV